MIHVFRITNDEQIQNAFWDIQSAKRSEASEICEGDYHIEDLKEYIKSPDRVFCVTYIDDIFSWMASAQKLLKPNGDLRLYVDEVDVCEHMQKKWAGTAMMKFLLNFAKENNFNELRLGTEIDNIPANALYKSLNPTDVEKFVGYNYYLNAQL